MDSITRQQVRLLIEHETEARKRAAKQDLDGLYQLHAAKGLLHSGATIKAAARLLESSASGLVTALVDTVAPVSKGIEAFAMISEAIETYFPLLREHLDRAVQLADPPRPAVNQSESIRRAADGLFDEMRTTVRRQLEIHRFTFIRPDPSSAYQPSRLSPIVLTASPAPGPPKNRGGRPLSEDWDEMWAQIAISLYSGDLQPKTQADIERAMMDWLAANGREGNESTVRPKARHLWRKLQDTQ